MINLADMETIARIFASVRLLGYWLAAVLAETSQERHCVKRPLLLYRPLTYGLLIPDKFELVN